MARQGRPFLMNVQTDEVTAERLEVYQQSMRASGYDYEYIAGAMDETWSWCNVFMAQTDSEAERIGNPLFDAQRVPRGKMRARIFAERGESMAKLGETGAVSAPARNVTEHSLICGSPDTVAERLSRIESMGVGGIILQFRLGLRHSK